MRRLPIAAVLALSLSAPAIAQSQPEPTQKQSIAAAVHWALPSPGAHTTPGVQLTWRRWTSPRLGIGTDVRWWRRTTSTEIDSPAQAGPDGVRIPSMQGHVDEQLASYAVATTLLGRTSAGRLSLIAGGGPGFFIESRTHDTRINASHSAGSTMLRSFGVHGLTEIELRATRRLSLFAGLRLELRDVRSMESNSGYPTVGVRFAF